LVPGAFGIMRGNDTNHLFEDEDDDEYEDENAQTAICTPLVTCDTFRQCGF
jgi:hypothetical protein